MYKPVYLSVLLFLISFYSLNSKKPSLISVPLKVIHNSFEKYPISEEAEYNVIKETTVKNIFGTKVRKLIQEKISGTVKKLDCLLFAAPLEIEREQEFNVILDTGSVNLWVPKVGSKDKYNITNHYDPDKSGLKYPTSDKFEITYGTGSTKGVYYKDKINFFNYIFYVKFGVATETNFDVDGADGIMGLAKKYEANEYSPIWTMFANNDISSKSFSIKYFSDDDVQMFLGDEHEDFKDENNTSTCQLLHNTSYDNLLWTCKLYSFGLISNDNKTMSNVSCGYNFLFDTGSNTMMLPYDTLELLKSELFKYNCYSGEGKNGYQILCEDINNLPHAFIEVGDYALFLNNKEMYGRFTDEKKDKEVYALNILFIEKITISLIGQPFFKLFHTKFDYENKVLKFYSDQPGSKNFTWVKPIDDKAKNYEPVGSSWMNEETIKIIVACAVAIAALFVLCVFYKCCKKILCGKKKHSTRGKQSEMTHL